jgi:hypothetical protein
MRLCGFASPTPLADPAEQLVFQGRGRSPPPTSLLLTAPSVHGMVTLPRDQSAVTFN